MSEAKIAVLGPHGTYSNEAATLYNPDAEIIYAKSIPDTIAMLAVGACKEAVVPIENSIGGNVTETLDGLRANRAAKLLVTDQFDLNIHHALVAIESPQDTSGLTVFSHHQGLVQCEKFIAERFDSPDLVELNSTVAGMDLMLKNNDRKAVAIGPELAARQRGLVVIEEGIEDNNTNQTSFMVLNSDPEAAADVNRTFIAILPQSIDHAGQLADALMVIKDNGINMKLIESRSHLDRLHSHLFYVGMDINPSDERLSLAVAGIEQTGAAVEKLTA